MPHFLDSAATGSHHLKKGTVLHGDTPKEIFQILTGLIVTDSSLPERHSCPRAQSGLHDHGHSHKPLHDINSCSPEDSLNIQNHTDYKDGLLHHLAITMASNEEKSRRGCHAKPDVEHDLIYHRLNATLSRH